MQSLNLERGYELAKRYGWPHFLLPLLALVVIDYVHLLLNFATIGLACYMMFQTLGFLFGTFIGCMVKLRTFSKKDDEAGSMWADVLNYKLATLVPTIGWGKTFFDWILTENAKPEDQVAEPSAE